MFTFISSTYNRVKKGYKKKKNCEKRERKKKKEKDLKKQRKRNWRTYPVPSVIRPLKKLSRRAVCRDCKTQRNTASQLSLSLSLSLMSMQWLSS